MSEMDESLRRAMKMTIGQRLLTMLAGGECVTRADMIQALWGDDPDGGPGDADACLNVHLYELGLKLAEDGWKIERVGGYALGLGKGREWDGRRAEKAATASGLPSTSAPTAGGSSPRKKRGMSSSAAAADRSPRMRSGTRSGTSAALTDFGSNPLQRIAS
jgi:hypothetical protein